MGVKEINNTKAKNKASTRAEKKIVRTKKFFTWAGDEVVRGKENFPGKDLPKDKLSDFLLLKSITLPTNEDQRVSKQQEKTERKHNSIEKSSGYTPPHSQLKVTLMLFLLERPPAALTTHIVPPARP